MIPRIEERRRIAETIAEMTAKRESVNEIQAVIDARQRLEDARDAEHRASIAFHRIFREHYPSDSDVYRACKAIAGDIVLDDFGLPARCAATGLAILDGDEVYKAPSNDEDSRSTEMVLAAAVVPGPYLIEKTIARASEEELDELDQDEDLSDLAEEIPA